MSKKEKSRGLSEPPLCALSLIECGWVDDGKTLGRIVYDVGGDLPVTRFVTESYVRQIQAAFVRMLREKDVVPIRREARPL